VRTEFPEVILFELDEAGAIRGVDIYMKQQQAAPRQRASASRLTQSLSARGKLRRIERCPFCSELLRPPTARQR
jgi:predicted DNA-binding protein (UPF0251 family)